MIWWLKSRQIWCLLLRLGWGRALVLPLKKFVLLSFRSCTNLDARAEEKGCVDLIYGQGCSSRGSWIWLLVCSVRSFDVLAAALLVMISCWAPGPGLWPPSVDIGGLQSPVEHRSSWPPWKPELVKGYHGVDACEQWDLSFSNSCYVMGRWRVLPSSFVMAVPDPDVIDYSLLLESWTLLDDLPHKHLDLCFQASAWGCLYG